MGACCSTQAVCIVTKSGTGAAIRSWKNGDVTRRGPVTPVVTPGKPMSDPEKYIPLSERVQQDVWHDNFVPKYSALASAKPSRLILLGVWLIFAPMAFAAIVMGLLTAYDAPDLPTAVISGIGPTFIFILAVAVLFTHTRRYRFARQQRPDARMENADEAPDEGVTTE